MAKKQQNRSNPLETGSLGKGLEPAFLPISPPPALPRESQAALSALAYAKVEPRVKLTLGVPFAANPKDDPRRYTLPSPVGLSDAIESLYAGEQTAAAHSRFKPGEVTPPYLRWLGRPSGRGSRIDESMNDFPTFLRNNPPARKP